jgi:hypothetical protein
MQTQDRLATDKQVAFIQRLTDQKGEATLRAARAKVGLPQDPDDFLTVDMARKLIDEMLDAEAVTPVPMQAPVPPVPPMPAPVYPATAPRDAKPITERQIRYLASLREERNISLEGMSNMTAAEASKEIETLKDTPKPQQPGVSLADREADNPVPAGQDGTPQPPPDPKNLVPGATFYRSLVGKTFGTSVADGGATYEVVEDMGETVRVAHVADQFDNYQDDLLRDGGVIGREMVERKLGIR